MNPKIENSGRCEKCRSEFACTADSGVCWCYDVKVERQALIEIEKSFGDCLCRNCLNEISEKFNAERFTTDKTSQ